MDRKKHIETINKVKKYVEEQDYEGLKLYIEMREIQIQNSKEENKASDYIDDLLRNLI